MQVLDIAPLPRPLHGTVEVRPAEALCTSGLWNTDSLPFNQANCDENPDFRPVASGGNGDTVQYCKTLT
jgi:hypothetical protein